MRVSQVTGKMCTRIFEYFVVCGMGPEIMSLENVKGYQGNEVMYMPSFVDQFPSSNHGEYPPPPPQLPTVTPLTRISNFFKFSLIAY